MSSYSMRSLLNPILPWEQDQEETSRFKKILLIFLGFSLIFSIIIPLIEIKKPERKKTTIPPRLVKMILEKKKVIKPPPPPEPKQEEKKEEEKPKEKEPEKKPEEPKPEKKPKKKNAKEVAKEHAAVFDALADLRDTEVVADLADSQNLSSNTGQAVTSTQTRSLITKNATQGSGGIKVVTASTSSGTGGKLVAQSSGAVKSEIGTAIENTQRVASSGSVKRSSENIQLTFEKYKSQIFSLYNRALRKNPGLQGSVNFRLVIEPNGKVSQCTIESSELNDSALEKRLISRIKRIDFGAMNVEVWNDTYLINFFPGG